MKPNNGVKLLAFMRLVKKCLQIRPNSIPGVFSQFSQEIHDLGVFGGFSLVFLFLNELTIPTEDLKPRWKSIPQ